MSQPEIDTFYADSAFLETAGTTADRVKAAVWAWLNLTDSERGYSLNEIREFLVESGFQVVQR